MKSRINRIEGSLEPSNLVLHIQCVDFPLSCYL